MNLAEFLADPSNRSAVREAILRIQREVAPAEVELTSAFLEPLLDLAARLALPSSARFRGAGTFGATDWMLLPIVFLVAGALETRLAGASRRDFRSVTEAEVRDLVRRSGSRRARDLVPELGHALAHAVEQHLATALEAAVDPDGRERRHTDISCPRQVWQGTDRFHLVVRLTIGPVPHSAADGTLEVATGKVVRVGLAAPDLDLLSAPWQEITVPPGRDSTPAVFDLRPRRAGHTRLTLDFFQGGNPLGTVTVPLEVVAGPVAEGRAERAPLLLVLESEAPAPDRVLLIDWHPGNSRLTITLLQRGGAEAWRFPPLELGPGHQPSAWAESLYRALDDLAEQIDPTAHQVLGRRRALAPAGVERRLRELGQNLWRALPEELRSLYARERKSWREGTLLIYSDEFELPWELVWPYGEGWEDDGPWCSTLRMSRWLRRNGKSEGNGMAPGRLHVDSLACIAPGDSRLAGARSEQSWLRRLLKKLGVRDLSPTEPTWDAVQDLLRSKRPDWLHVSAHGSPPKAPGRHPVLWLPGLEALTPESLVGPEIEGWLRRDRAAFFFNVCHSGRHGRSLTGIGGWADRLIACGAGLFLGTLWRVEDEAARRAARALYEHLFHSQPKTVTEAVHAARVAAREAGGPTWLAYTLYAHPNAKVRLPGDASAGRRPAARTVERAQRAPG